MQNNFTELGISPAILKAIEEMGFVEPTEVQSQAIPPIFNHEDVIVMSKTGSGKTAVFGIPMLQMTDPDETGPQGLILTPTRELAVQIDSDLKLMSKYLPYQTAVVYGQHSMNVEVQALKKGVSIVVGTPGRVFDHLRQGNLVTKHIRFLVLDEADRMLDMGFLNQVVRIIRTLPKNRVTLLFSATIPVEVQRISRDFMNKPVMIEIESQTMTVDTVRQFYYRIYRNEKQTQLNRILLSEQPESCMIFCNTRFAVDQVQSFLSRKGYYAQSLHGDIPQAKRTKTIEQFKQGVFHILVATDVAARGLHIDDLSLVINYDVPLEKDGYVHRIGRTGRAGKEGLAITLVTSEDIMSLYAIEEHTGAMIQEAELPTDEMLDNVKEGAAQWIQANSNRSSSDSSDSDKAVSKPRNDRKKSNPALGSAPARPRNPKPGRVLNSATPSPISNAAVATVSPSIGNVPGYISKPIAASKPGSTQKPDQHLPYNNPREFQSAIIKPFLNPAVRNTDSGVRNNSAAKQAKSDMVIQRKPHSRTIGGSQEEIPAQLPAKAAVKAPVKAYTESSEKSLKKSAIKSTMDDVKENATANPGKPRIAKIFKRLFNK